MAEQRVSGSEPPAPASVGNRLEFIEALRGLKVWAGNPSLADLQRLTAIPRSTLGDALDPSRPGLPRLAVVTALVQACGCGPAEVLQWERAWKAVQQSDDRKRTDEIPPRLGGGVGRGGALPGDLSDFAGRTVEIDQLLAVADSVLSGGLKADNAAVSIIDGMAGIGKTALAVHVAHRLRSGFPDGSFFLDLQAHTTGQLPVEAMAALELLLRAWGVAADAIPPTFAERAEAWVEIVSAKRVLIVLDNAASAAQVRPLLANSAGSLTLITSRNTLSDLDGSQCVSLDVLSAQDAIGLFTEILGERVAAEQDGVAEAVRLCGYLPLAIRLAAARLRARPAWSLEYLVGRLSDRGRRLSELATPERGVAAAFSMSYQQLSAEQRRMFRLLGLHPGLDIDIHAAAALAGQGAYETEVLLENLLDDHLLSQYVPGRYTFHDLLRDHAQQAAAADSADVRREAISRLLDHYRFASAAAMDVLVPHERHRRPVIEPPAAEPRSFADETSATIWLDAERGNLIAVAELATSIGLLTYAPDLSTILWRYLDSGSHLPGALALHTQAMHAARGRGDLAAQANAVRHLSAVFWRLARYDEAIEHFQLSLGLSREAGDQAGERAALTNLGVVYAQLGRFKPAAENLQRAFDLYRESGDHAGQAAAGTNLGIVNERLGSYQAAISILEEARSLYRAAGDHVGEGLALGNLANTYIYLGRYRQGIDVIEQSMALKTAHGRLAADDHSMISLARAYLRTGDDQLALDHLQQAAAFQASTGDRTSEGEVLNLFGVYFRHVGRTDLALEQHERALRISRELDDRFAETESLNELGISARAAGDPSRALVPHQQAIEIASASGFRYEEARGHHGLADASYDLGDGERAREGWQRALDLYIALEVPEVDEVRSRLQGPNEPDGSVRNTG